jgi:hypothetical protein
MNDRQQDAINDLELAFAKAKRAGLVFCGMETNIYCYLTLSVRKETQQGASQYTAFALLQKESVTINTSGTYLDSGGW